MSSALQGTPVPLFDFHGGIHPPENKHQSTQVPIRPGPLASQLVLPLNMHIGAPAKPVVEVGQRVLKGQLIADANGAVSVPVHAPTSGTIAAIGPRPIQHPSGLDAPCIVLDVDGEETWGPREPVADYLALSRSDLLERIRTAGIAGMGGAGFPSAIKLNLRDGQAIEHLIINAVECEPYITADDMLMRERAADIIQGIRILQHVVSPQQTLVGIEDNKPEAIASMRAAAQGTDIQIISVPTKYPSGGEKQLIQLLTGKEVPSGHIPAEVGVVCQNTGTVYAIYKAIIEGEPLISRITTLTGNAFAQPGNVEVLIGTPVSDLLHDGGARPDTIHRLIMGGPMMGFTIHNPQVPVVKTTNCIIAAPEQELPSPAPEQPCIRCGSCAEVCPASLLPQQLYWYSKNEEFERAQHYNLMDCIECGACAYVCPSNIPLVQYYRFAKGELRNLAAASQKSDKARLRFEARTERLEKAQAEKEARKQARLDANRKKKQGTGHTAASSSVDLKALKAASMEASKAYKAAVKAAKAAEAEGADNAAALRAKADELKAQADQAKAAVREAGQDAGNDAPAASAPSSLEALKKAVGEASAAYKAAVKAAKAAEAEGADNAPALRSQADELKAHADQLKAELRDAKAASPAGPSPDAPPVQPPSSGSATVASPAQGEAQRDDAQEAAAKRAQKMKALKTAYNMANKQWKEARAALERAERAADNDQDIDTLRAKVDKLKFKADKARDALDVLVEEAKQGLKHATGADLKTLKIDAARAATKARETAQKLATAQETGDNEQIRTLHRELEIFEAEASDAAQKLKQATDAQGLTDS